MLLRVCLLSSCLSLFGCAPGMEDATPPACNVPAVKPPSEAPLAKPSVPSYKWPPGFPPPIDIHIDAPEVPPEIAAPTPMPRAQEG